MLNFRTLMRFEAIEIIIITFTLQRVKKSQWHEKRESEEIGIQLD